MAEGGIELSPKQSSGGWPAGDDDEVEASCDPCLYDDHHVESVTYCLECEERLCKVCKVQHRKLRATRNHHLIDPGAADDAPNQAVTESCPDHSRRNIEYFCEDHRQLCCSLCISVDHQKCRKITHILNPDVISGIKSSAEFKQANDRIQYLIEKFGDLKIFKEHQIQKIHKQSDDILNTIKQVRAKINTLLDKIEKTAVGQTSNARDKLTDELSHERDTYQGIVSSLHSSVDRMERVNRSAGEAQAYITLRKTAHHIQRYDEFLAEINMNLKNMNLSFKVGEIINNFTNNVETIGDITVQSPLTKSADKAHRTSSLSIKRKIAVPAGGHAVRIPDDKTTCFITGSAFFDDGRLLLADYNNKTLKLFDANCKFIDHKTLRHRPVDVAIVNQGEVVASLMGDNSLEFVTVDAGLNVGRRVKTEESYSGVCCSKHSEIYAACCQSDKTGEIHVLDLRGTILRYIGGSIEHGLTLTKPTSVILSKNENQLYVSDIGQNCVFCIDIGLSSSGNRVLCAYRDRTLELRQGLAVDNDGNIYVASSNSSVHQVAYTGNKIHDIITVKDGISQPHSLCFSEKNNKLLVAEYKENSVKIFHLS